MIEVNVTKELLSDLNLATQKILAEYKLKGSDLSKSINFKYEKDTFVLLANDYFSYVSTGRRPKARLVPIEDLIKWMKKKGIAPHNGSYNTVAYLIQQAIYRNGIKAKNFINPIVDITSTIITEDLALDLSDQIAKEIANDLTQTI